MSGDGIGLRKIDRTAQKWHRLGITKLTMGAAHRCHKVNFREYQKVHPFLDLGRWAGARGAARDPSVPD